MNIGAYGKNFAILGLLLGLVGQGLYIWNLKQNYILIPVPPMQADISAQEEPQALEPAASADEEVIGKYVNSEFKVVAVVPNTFDKRDLSTLYIVTKRGPNDNRCGGQHDAGQCYFFAESDYEPRIKFIGVWGAKAASLESAKFVDEDTVHFQTRGTNEVSGLKELWELDIQTGSTSRMSYKNQDYGS